MQFGHITWEHIAIISIRVIPYRFCVPISPQNNLNESLKEFYSLQNSLKVVQLSWCLETDIETCRDPLQEFLHFSDPNSVKGVTQDHQ